MMNRRAGALSRLVAVLIVVALALAAGLAGAGGAGSASAQTLIDYDDDDDGLIDVRNVDQLNAIRYDLLGVGSRSETNYVSAFPNPANKMGCPGSRCKGYELRADLDFDTDNDGDVDSDDDYPNWQPIGPTCATFDKFQTVFKGNGYTISNLKMNNSFNQHVGLFGMLGGDIHGRADISGFGLEDVDITSTRIGGGADVITFIGAVAGFVCGEIMPVRDIYATGSVSYTGTGREVRIGGLIGRFGDRSTALRADVNVSSTARGTVAGGLVGEFHAGPMTASYAAGDVSVSGSYSHVGGLVGLMTGHAVATYAAGDVSASGANSYAGGYAGQARGDNSVNIAASYAAGSVAATGTDGVAGGFIGRELYLTGAQFPDSYWDSTTTGIADDMDDDMPEGKATADLKSPLDYVGIYADWNVNVDVNLLPGVDDPWDFGYSTDYPALKFGGMDLPSQFASAGDYDRDDDGLIEIYDLDMLNAVRWDLDGDAAQDGVSATDWAKHGAAFPDAIASHGCPDSNSDSSPGPCAGYELAANLDFDQDGNGYVEAPGDAYPNWTPIGDSTTVFSASFDGNGKTVSNLTIDSAAAAVGLFGAIGGSGAAVTGVGLIDVDVTASAASASVGALAGVLSRTGGAARSVFATGSLSASGNSSDAGGLVGSHVGGTVAASWADVDVSSSGSGAEIGGLTGRSGGTILAAHAAGAVAATGDSSYAGGLTGRLDVGTIRYAYAVGAVSETGSGGGAGGLVGGLVGSTTIAASYWDTAKTGQADDGDALAPEGLTTDALQSPTGYTGVYSTWNADVDGQSGNDDPWDFGTVRNYPALKFGVQKPDDQREDYDQDDDGLIEISNLAQLNAVRWDLDGDAAQDGVSAADWKKYGTVFFNAQASLGCPDTDDTGTDPGPCAGFELAANLDFDTDGDGATYTGTGAGAAGDSGDGYYNGGAGFEPIGGNASAAARYNAAFDGNGYTVSNLFIRRTARDYAGLFGAIGADARIESVSVVDAYVYARNYAGVLAGGVYGDISAAYVEGEVIAARYAGGMAGAMPDGSGASITAAYSNANVSRQGSPGSEMGGLLGLAGTTTAVTAAYSTGTVTTSGGNRGGLIGSIASTADVDASYWDLTASGIADDMDTNMPEGKTTAQLQAPISYAGIYADWSVNPVGSGAGIPWDFGNSSEYPALEFGGMNPVIQRGDYDRDDDGMIEIYDLDQLNAIRWDLDGDAVQDTTNAANWKKYGTAFLNALPSLGCADTNSDSSPGPCDGFELVRDLEFDADASGKVDSDDPYPNWTPIGDNATRFTADFEGNGHVVSNMKIETSVGNSVGLFGVTGMTASVSGVGALNAEVTVSGAANFTTYAGILIGRHDGVARGAYATGSLSQTGGGTNGYYGGLIGYFGTGSAYASWADVDVSADAAQARVGGFAGRFSSGTSASAAYASGSASASGAMAKVGGFAGELYGEAAAVYATAAVSASGATAVIGGIAAEFSSSTDISHSYWDTAATGVVDDAGDDSPEGVPTADLQAVPTYAGIYAGWNLNVDGANGADDPWDFGFATEYPALKFGSQDPYTQRGDYDRDDDGLIEISNLDRLNAVRWDMNGDGERDWLTDARGWAKYKTAFANAVAAMGCPDTLAADLAPGPGLCDGFELAAHLDFDANGDGVVDSEDPYPNWTPIGSAGPDYWTRLNSRGQYNEFTATFDGNFKTVSNLKINSMAQDVGLFGAAVGYSIRFKIQSFYSFSARISRLGVTDAEVTSFADSARVGALAGFSVRGAFADAYATGGVTAKGSSAMVGGLFGYSQAASYSSWADATVSASGASSHVGGFAGQCFNCGMSALYALGEVSSTGDDSDVGGMVGKLNQTRPKGVYVLGAVTKSGDGGSVGGFAGSMFNSFARAAYSAGSVSSTGDDVDVAGFAGNLTNSGIYSSYAAGAVTKSGTGGSLGGLLGDADSRSIIENAYWDTQTTNIADDADEDMPEGKTTSELQSPVGYTGIYADWNLDLTGLRHGNDNPWDFGDADEYPALRYWLGPHSEITLAPLKQYRQRGDYDTDDDGLIEIYDLDMLNAVRWDLDGDGAQDSTSDADWAKYERAFQNAKAGMGCPDSDSDSSPGPCAGYELAQDLDFDTNEGGIVTFNDAYPNWTPVGDSSGMYAAAFDFGGKTVSNLTINSAAAQLGLFGAVGGSASVTRAALRGVNITAIGAAADAGALAGVLNGAGAAARYGYAIGSLTHTGTGSADVGGLIGAVAAGTVAGVWTDVSVSSSGEAARVGGMFGDSAGTTAAAYAAGPATTTGDDAYVGGFAGRVNGGSTRAAYAIGAVTKSGTGGGEGGFVGDFSSGSVSAVYWDSQTTTIADDPNTAVPEGKTTAQLQSPTRYAGIFADWNANLDGFGGGDDPWTFGGASDYPVLNAGGMKPYIQTGDYDTDDDGLIEIHDLYMLNAIRWDLDGDAVQDVNDDEWEKYNAAFFNAKPSLGCPDTDDADSLPGPCAGYELARNLDFDADGDGDVDFDDPYYNWTPIGAQIYTAAFDGNGKTISNLTMNTTATYGGLFARLDRGATVSRLGLLDVNITTTGANTGALAGILVAASSSVRYTYATGSLSHTSTGGGKAGGLIGAHGTGTVAASWADVDVSSSGAGSRIGGLIGAFGGNVIASYATGSVTATGANSDVGGLIGQAQSGTIDASYAVGEVDKRGTGGNEGGLVGDLQSGATVTNSYWDATATGIADDANNDSPEGETTANLKSPTAYGTGQAIYADWNVSVDGVSGNDDPWDFGEASDYPALKSGGMKLHIQNGDYDQDNDGLIEIHDLNMLNAVRWDLDGDAVQDSTPADDWKKYGAAFYSANAKTSAGCSDTDSDSSPGPCVGYELAQNLDFDTDGDGDVDVADAYPNWTPVGGASSAFSATLDGGNKTISNLRISASSSASSSIGLFANSSGTVMKIGLPNAEISATGGDSNTHVGALLGETSGSARGAWATGWVSQTGSGTGGDVGGLIGYSSAGSVNASWSGVHVSSSAAAARVGGLVGRISGTSLNAVYSTGAVSAAGNNAYAGGIAGEIVTLTEFRASYATGPATKTGTGGASGALYGTRGSVTTRSALTWDTGTTGYAAGSGGSEQGRATSALSMPTDYTGIYSTWNVNVDGAMGADDPWDFGRRMQYPMLKWGGMSLVAQGSLAMGMPRVNGDYPVVGQNAGVCLVSGPSLRGPPGSRPAWQWQRSPDGATWTNIPGNGGPTYSYTATAADVGNYLRACVPLIASAPEGAREACVHMFAKTQAATTP